MLRIFALILIGVFALNCSKPSIGRELDGKIKGKAKLRLAGGATISQPDSDEYNPQIVTLSDGYLVLAFGSDRACGTCTQGYHNIFIAKSLTAYDGIELPFFQPPQPLQNESITINDPGRVNFAIVPDGTGIKVYLNYHAQSSQIWFASINDVSTPNPALGAITNSSHVDNTVIGANGAGDRLITTDFSGIAYVINPGADVPADPFGFGLDYSQTAFQVRQENSGFDDSYIAAYYGSSYATTASFPLGPIIDLDFSLIGSGLFLSTMGPLYSSDPYGDLVLFSAYDEFSEDIYIITSHTAGGLWSLVGFFGSDAFMPAAPVPDHYYSFDLGCGTLDIGTWTGSCTGVGTGTTVPLNGSDYGDFSGSAYMNIGGQDLGADFTLTAWVYIPGTPTGQHTIVSNVNSTANASGFRLYVDANDGMKLKFDVADGSTTVSIASYQFAIAADTWHHVAIAVNSTYQYAYLYVDGAIVNETFFSWVPTISAFNTTSSNIYWGANNDASSGLIGYLENLRIYLREVTPPEIMAEMFEF